MNEDDGIAREEDTQKKTKILIIPIFFIF